MRKFNKIAKKIATVILGVSLTLMGASLATVAVLTAVK